MKTLFVIAIVLGALAIPPPARAEEGAKPSLPVEKAAIRMKDGKTHEFDVEIAKTPVDLQMGLMFRKEMAPDHGMLFQLHKQPRRTSFWMKNTYIPLDIIFIAEDGRIVNIHRKAEPHSLQSIPSVEPCTGVIEINGGRADELGIKVGDTVIHPYFDGGGKKE